ncbi:MAG: ATP synthase F1 subunit gamma [Bacteroidia bacterium]|jgi:F-type H+-transporting ATPase subunit gamma|nr:ATP synthase F1 subunit gamma [Bacteroidia bacterium]
MANLKEVRNRIVSVGSTMQITSAMKMVSAAKLKRAQDAITQMRPYANKLQEILQNVSSSLDSSENVYARNTSSKNVLLICISSNRGLAGGFNSNVIKKTWSLIKNEYAGNNVFVMSIGKKANDAFKRTEYNIHGTDLPHELNDIFDQLNYNTVAPIAEKVMESFVNKQFDKVVLVYNQFKNAAIQIVQDENFLPVVATQNEGKTSSTDYAFEPSKEFIIGDLIPRSLKTQFYKALLDSVASEHGARMTAMHKATDNAKDMLRDLKISYNKARQTAITTEILEIVAGAEALNG